MVYLVLVYSSSTTVPMSVLCLVASGYYISRES